MLIKLDFEHFNDFRFINVEVVIEHEKNKNMGLKKNQKISILSLCLNNGFSLLTSIS